MLRKEKRRVYNSYNFEYHMPGAFPDIQIATFHSFLQVSKIYIYSHFSNEDTEAQILSKSPTITGVLRGRARICIQICVAKVPPLFTLTVAMLLATQSLVPFFTFSFVSKTQALVYQKPSLELHFNSHYSKSKEVFIFLKWEPEW